MPDMHGKKFFAGGVFILLGVLSVDAWFSLHLQRSKVNDNPSIGYQRERTGGEIAWEELCWEGAALKMRSCWHRFYTKQHLHRGALHRGALLGGSFTQRSLYTGRTLHTESFTQRNFQLHRHRKGFTHRSFYTEKSLYRVVLTQRSLHTQRLLHREAFYTEQLLHGKAFTRKSLYTQRL